MVPGAHRHAGVRAAGRLVGSDRNATLLGRPAIDMQAAYERNWPNIAAFDYAVWHVGAALKLGRRF